MNNKSYNKNVQSIQIKHVLGGETAFQKLYKDIIIKTKQKSCQKIISIEDTFQEHCKVFKNE